jgi:hypothetical protein
VVADTAGAEPPTPTCANSAASRPPTAAPQARRRKLERIADQLGDLDLELSYSVEATADLGLLVRALRAESFHNALYESMSPVRVPQHGDSLSSSSATSKRAPTLILRTRPC